MTNDWGNNNDEERMVINFFLTLVSYMIAAAVFAMMLCMCSGCATKRAALGGTTVRETQIDTSKAKADSILKSILRQEKRTSVTLYNDWGCIEFADSGGSLTIDGDGKIVANGVKAYHQGKQAEKKLNDEINEQADSTATHKEQANGINNDNTRVPAPAERQLSWWERNVTEPLGDIVKVLLWVCSLVVLLVCAVWVWRRVRDSGKRKE